MSPSLLTEFRCSCGKLLLKAFLGCGIAEVKCKRCGLINAWESTDTESWALVECDAKERLYNVGGNTLGILGYAPEELLGRNLSEVLLLSRDETPEVLSGAYQLRTTNLLLRDGTSQYIKSTVDRRSENGNFTGYRIYSIRNT